MKTAVIYYSCHHGNTRKLVEAIARDHEVDLIDAAAQKEAGLSPYDLIGGTRKGHPDARDLEDARRFFAALRAAGVRGIGPFSHSC